MSEGEFSERGAEHPEPKHVSARVPESVAKGEFCTGVVVMASPQELVLDFIQTLVQPNQLVSRVVMPWPTLPSLLKALRQNLENHDRRFGSHLGTQPTETMPDEADGEEPESGPGEQVMAGKSSAKKTYQAESSSSQPFTRRVEAVDFYEDLRFEDKTLRGVYANGAMINHTEFEFKLDFLSTLHPYVIVVARIFMSEPQMRRFLASLEQHGPQRRG
jgi:hypothetical protein